MGELVPNRYKTAAFSAVVVLCFVGISFAPIIGGLRLGDTEIVFVSNV